MIDVKVIKGCEVLGFRITGSWVGTWGTMTDGYTTYFTWTARWNNYSASYSAYNSDQ